MRINSSNQISTILIRSKERKKERIYIFEEKEKISDWAIKARFLQRYIILMNIDTTRSIAFAVREAVHIHQWWYDDDDDDVDCIHITSRVCSLRWQDRQALFIIYIYISNVDDMQDDTIRSRNLSYLWFHSISWNPSVQWTSKRRIRNVQFNISLFLSLSWIICNYCTIGTPFTRLIKSDWQTGNLLVQICE